MNEATLKNLVPKMGRILKLYREKCGFKQCDVARKAGISTSMLSQIERGQVSPSIDTLVLVCVSLGLDPVELFKGIVSSGPVTIHHPNNRLHVENRGIRYEQLITGRNGTFSTELFLLQVAPGASSIFSGQGHEGVEMGYVLQGEAVLMIEEKEYNVYEGDSISFNSQFPHGIQNRGKEPFKAVWSISPPHIDYFGNKEN